MEGVKNSTRSRRPEKGGISRDPRYWLEWLIIGLLAFLLLQTLAGYGGWIREGYRMAGVAPMVGAVALLHVVWRVLHPRAAVISRWALIPLPFLAYAGLSTLQLTPAPWHGNLVFWTLLQAWVIFVVAASHLRHRRRQYAFLGILVTVGVVAFIGAAIQVYINPDWMPGADRLRSPEFGRRAAGFLGDPDAFAALMLMLFPVAFIGAFLRQLSGPVRILFGFLAFLFALGVVISESRSALIALLLGMVLMPTFLAPGLRRRLRLLGRFALAALILIPVLYFGSDLLSRSMASAVKMEGGGDSWMLRAGAISMFMDQPVIGQGIGAFETIWPQVQPGPMAGRPTHSSSELLQVLAEYGLLGAVFLLLPLGWFIVRVTRAWRNTPFQAVSEEVLFRESSGGRHRRRRRPRYREGAFPAPRKKVLLGGLLAGMLLGLGQSMGSSAMQLPVVLFLLVAIAALSVSVVAEDEPEVDLAKAIPAVGRLVLPVALLVSAFLLMTRAKLDFLAQGDVLRGQEQLEVLLEDPDSIFTSPARLHETEQLFHFALALNPRHGGALTGVGLTRLGRYYIDYAEPEKAGAAAMPFLSAAIEACPEEYSNYLFQANALAWQGAAYDSVQPLLECAVLLAPHVPQAHLQYANFLFSYSGDGQAAMKHLQVALNLDPDLEEAILLRNDIRLR